MNIFKSNNSWITLTSWEHSSSQWDPNQVNKTGELTQRSRRSSKTFCQRFTRAEILKTREQAWWPRTNSDNTSQGMTKSWRVNWELKGEGVQCQLPWRRITKCKIKSWKKCDYRTKCFPSTWEIAWSSECREADRSALHRATCLPVSITPKQLVNPWCMALISTIKCMVPIIKCLVKMQVVIHLQATS